LMRLRPAVRIKKLRAVRESGQRWQRRTAAYHNIQLIARWRATYQVL